MEVLVSVILPIYNTPLKWVSASIESILNQSFTQLECILINDDPQNEQLGEFLETYQEKDRRVVLLENEGNVGLPKSLNKGIQIAKGKYIARMDADDIALLDRIEKQYDFMQQNPQFSLVGGQVQKMDADARELSTSNHPINFKLLRRLIPYQNPSTHPTWFFRKKDIEEVGKYRAFPNAEDYDLLARLILAGKQVINLSDILLHYRVHYESQSIKKHLEQKLCIQYIQESFIDRSISNFDKNKLKEFLEKNSTQPNSSPLFKARSQTNVNFFVKLKYIILAVFDSSIERRYLINLLKVRFIKLLYRSK